MDMNANLKPALLGAAGGAIALALVGFTWGGWVTQSKAQSLAKSGAADAVVAMLAPICLSQFQSGPDALGKQTELKKLSAYDQGGFVAKAGWATMPGAKDSDPAVARACADMISKAVI